MDMRPVSPRLRARVVSAIMGRAQAAGPASSVETRKLRRLLPDLTPQVISRVLLLLEREGFLTLEDVTAKGRVYAVAVSAGTNLSECQERGRMDH